MKAKILVRVERDAALEAIRTLDALRNELQTHERHCPKKLRRRYEKTRLSLVRAAGWWAQSNEIADMASID